MMLALCLTMVFFNLGCSIDDAEEKRAKKLFSEGFAFAEKEQYDDAIEKVLEAKSILNRPLDYFFIGKCYYKKRDFDKATEFFDKAIRSHSPFTKDSETFVSILVLSYNFKTQINLANDNYPEALKNCKRALFHVKNKEMKKCLEGMKEHLEKLLTLIKKK